MAKVDATVDGKVAASYKVQGYPTLFFFHKGEKIDYNGQRSKDILINWLLKKTRDPLVPIDQAGYEKLQTEDKVSIVFHGDASSTQGQLVSKIAVADDYNSKKLIIQLITLPKSEKLKAVLKSSDHSIQSLLMKVLMRD
jgi:thioredoxin-like negative regulator of GroEL